MRSYGWVGTVVIGVVLLAVAGGCRTKPAPALPPIKTIESQKDDGVKPEPVARGGDVVPPPTQAMQEGERPPDGSRVDVAFTNVMFEFDSFKVMASEVPKIEAVADYMRRNSVTKLVTEGHCDERGSNEYNMSLGEHRAQAVRAHLIGLGVDAGRIQTRSFGEEKPADPNHNETAWRKNRRVEFALFR